MLPKISNHFIQRARERAPWLLSLEDLDFALQQSSEIENVRSISIKIKYCDQDSKYLLIPKLSNKRKSVVLVIADDSLVTVYRADECGWLLNAKTVEPKKRKRRRH